MEQRRQSRDEVLLNKLTEIVLKNLENEQFGVTELSKEVGISRFHLHRKLKALEGKSVSQFIRELRLMEAMKMLRDDVGTASEISYRVGFASPSYFNSCFQKHYGYPPGEVKKLSVDTNVSQLKEVIDEIPKTREKHGDGNNLRVSEKKSLVRRFALPFAIIVIMICLVAYFFTNRDVRPNLEKSIAVLPFNNLSSDPDNQHFADGLVEDLLNRLSVIKEFKVISRTSSEMYRVRGSKSVPQIAEDLSVSYIVEGSVQKFGSKARINIQLINAREDDHIWSQFFDRDIKDIFTTQSEIATHIATALNAILTSEQTLGIQRNQTTSFNAFEQYHLGRFYWNQRTGDGYNRSIECFEKAIDEDQNYGLAYAGLADTYHLMAIQGYIPINEGMNQAVDLALRALELDENLAEAYTVLGSVYCYIKRDWKAAEIAFERAIEINPNYATAHHYYSEFLSMMGRHDGARIHINKAIELDPLSFVIRWVSTKLYYHQGQFHEALAENLRSHELQKNHTWSLWYSFKIYRQLGMDDKAFSAFIALYDEKPYYNHDELKKIYALSGIDGIIRWSIDKDFQHEDSAGYGSWYSIANKYGMLGDVDNALKFLEKGMEEQEIDPEISFNIHFKNLENHPRYIALIKKMGFPAN